LDIDGYEQLAEETIEFQSYTMKTHMQGNHYF